MRGQAPAVQQHTALELLDPSGGHALLSATLRFDPVSDPYAVTAAFELGSEEVVWTFARDLLVEGLREPAGDGDVHIWPAEDEDGHAVVAIELNSPDGSALLQVSRDDVHRFLAETLRSVPLGTESDHLDVDGLVRALLSA